MDRLDCDKYKMLCDDENDQRNPLIKNFLEENCPNTCGYCSKFILDIAARLIQLDDGVLLLLLSKKRTNNHVCHMTLKRYYSKTKSQLM